MSKELEVSMMDKLLRLNLTVKILLVLFFEVVLITVILTTIPFDSSSIQLYELFVVGELLAVILLNPWSVFWVASLNTFFIVVSLLYQSHTTAFNQDLQLQFWSILLRPIALQFLVALMSYLWITHVYAYIQRVSLAKTKAAETQQRTEQQKAEAEKNLILLQNSIERIVYKHATVMNQRLFTKIPLTEYEPALWPLINAFNSLQNRLQHTYQVEHELQDLQGAISTHVELIGQGGFSRNQLVHTHTALDMLLNSLCEMHKANPYQEAYPTALLDLTNARTLKLKLENLWLSNSQESYARGKQINDGWNIDYSRYVPGKDEWGSQF